MNDISEDDRELCSDDGFTNYQLHEHSLAIRSGYQGFGVAIVALPLSMIFLVSSKTSNRPLWNRVLFSYRRSLLTLMRMWLILNFTSTLSTWYIAFNLRIPTKAVKVAIARNIISLESARELSGPAILQKLRELADQDEIVLRAQMTVDAALAKLETRS